MSWAKIMECVPNFSEGRDLQKIDQIVSPFRAKAGVKLLDYSNDEDHNRLVVTVVGEPEALKEAVIEAIGVAVKLIDLNQHKGQHLRHRKFNRGIIICAIFQCGQSALDGNTHHLLAAE